MKVTKEKREEIRRALVASAVALAVEKGLSELSMREVAARADVAPGTAYKYFPNREQLVHTFFEMKLDDALAALGQIPGVESFTLKENLQALLEALLAEYLNEREFVALALRGLIESPLQAVGAMQGVKEKLTQQIEALLKKASADGALPAGSYQGFVARAFWDYTIVVVLYWLKDDSEDFARTTEFIDHSLDLYVALVSSGFVDKAAQLFGFLLKNHLHDYVSQIAQLVSAVSQLAPRGPTSRS